MRKAIAGLLSLPVIGALYLLPVARRRAALRMVAVLGVGALFTLVALSSSATPTASAFKSAPVDTAALARISTSVVTGHGLSEPVTIVFSEPVDMAKVTAALQVTPAAAVRLDWSPDGTLLHVTPVSHWAPSTLYTLSLSTTAVGRDGTSLPSPLSALFLTRSATTATATVQPGVGATATAPIVDLSFSTPVTASAVAAALTVTPAVVGKVSTIGPDQGAPETAYQWQATEPLAPGSSYSLSLASDLRDVEGAPLAAGVTVKLQVAALPTVVRMRPATGSTNVALSQAVSVRFSQPMDRASTQAAFHISAYTSPAKQGRFSWTEGGTVLVWTPRAPFGYGSHYTVTVDGSARSAAGQPLGADPAATVATATFSTVHRPAAKPRTVDKPKPSGGGSTSAPWYSTEKYFLSLINCDHTGGWVSSSGVCTGRGSNGHAALTLSAAVSNGASRPWAKYLAQTSQLYHGCPACRLSAIGYGSGWWGENLAWWSGTPTEGAIQAILFFQSEKAAKGGHYLNMMDTRGRIAGVGVWQANGRVVFAIDFVA
ncbi:MAG TPA: Ig-like domain-containing protein [Candidatus Baltobacteraceae bacterium]|nr:Ig-like domain-containing protein [Candidatus Baltobacteraceae bacterium]